MLMNVKTFGVLTFVSMVYATFESLKARKMFTF